MEYGCCACYWSPPTVDGGGSLPTVHLGQEKELYEENTNRKFTKLATIPHIPHFIEVLQNTSQNLDHINQLYSLGFPSNYFTLKSKTQTQQIQRLDSALKQLPANMDNTSWQHENTMVNIYAMHQINDEAQEILARHKRDTTADKEQIISGGVTFPNLIKYTAHLSMPGCPKSYLSITKSVSTCIIKTLNKIDPPRTENMGQSLRTMLTASVGKKQTWSLNQVQSLGRLLGLDTDSMNTTSTLIRKIVNTLQNDEEEKWDTPDTNLLTSATITDLIIAVDGLASEIDVMKAETELSLKTLAKKQSNKTEVMSKNTLDQMLLLASTFYDLLETGIAKTINTIVGETNVVRGRVAKLSRTEKNEIIVEYYPVERIPGIAGILAPTPFCSQNQCMLYTTPKMVGTLHMDVLYLQQHCFIQNNIYVCRHRLNTPPACFYPHPRCDVTIRDETLPKIRLLNPYQILVSQLEEEMTVGPFYLQRDHIYSIYSSTKTRLKNITILASPLVWQYHVETLSISQLDLEDRIKKETQSSLENFFIQATTNSTLLGAIILILSVISLCLCCKRKSYQKCPDRDSDSRETRRVRIAPNQSELNNLSRIKRIG